MIFVMDIAIHMQLKGKRGANLVSKMFTSLNRREIATEKVLGQEAHRGDSRSDSCAGHAAKTEIQLGLRKTAHIQLREFLRIDEVEVKPSEQLEAKTGCQSLGKPGRIISSIAAMGESYSQ